MNRIAELIRRRCIVPDRRQPWEWAGGILPDRSDAMVNFGQTRAFKGTYDVTNVPWTKEFLRRCNDPKVREATLIAPPQESGKTVASEIFLAYIRATRPTNAAFNTTTNVKAEQWSQTRWESMMKSVKGLAATLPTGANRHNKKARRIIFKDGTFLLIQGANEEGNRASDSVEVQVNDECYLWDRPAMKEMHGRTDAYRATRKIVNISVGGIKGSEIHERFLAGNQGEWHHECPNCRKPLGYVFDTRSKDCNIRFDLNAAIVHADGRLDLREFAKTIRVVCPHCEFPSTYDPERLRRQNLAGFYLDKNPDADPSVASMHINSFAIGRTPWVEILEPWVRMNLRGGVFAMATLKEFITKPLADFWDEKPHAVTTELKLAGWTRAEMMKPGAWDEELFRVMICDNQHGAEGDIEHRWFAGVAFSKTGRMRIFDAGRINDWPSVRAKQVELGVPDPTEEKPGPWVVVDRRYNPMDVDKWCAQFQWYGSMGAAQTEFVHPAYSDFAGTRQLFSEMRLIDIGYGSAAAGRTFSTYFLWSAQRFQDLVAELRKAGMIEFAADSGTWAPELPRHMNSHRQFMERDRHGKEQRVWKRIGDTPDHLYDIVCQAAVCGAMAGIYQRPDDLRDDPPPPA